MMSLTRMKRPGLVAGAVVLPVVMVVLLGALSSAVVAGPEDAPSQGEAVPVRPMGGAPVAAERVSAQAGFVLRFDPVQESFESFAVPTDGANPNSVDVVSHGSSFDVWFTEPGADKIGRLVYTATNDYTFYEYPVTAGGEPLNLAVDGQRRLVWFTEQAGNRIGRLEIGSGGAAPYVGFGVPTANSRPAGIDLASDGSVWFSEMGADRIGHLVVTSTSDYQWEEYPIGRSGVGAYDVEVQSDQYVWFVETARDRLTRLKVDDKSMGIFVALDQGSYPFDILYDAGRNYLWVTELGDNQISQIEFTTINLMKSYDVPPPGGAPRGLTRVGSNHFWFSEHASGRISRLVYTSPTSFHFDAFTLPVKGLFVPDIAADDDGALWVVAYEPNKVHLPLAIRNYRNDPPSLFGVQMYGTVNGTSGLSEMVAAGVRWIRLPVLWEGVEPVDVAPDDYNWAYVDSQVAAITAAGVEPLLILQGNPEWAAVYPMGPVTDVADLQEFMGALVERYDGDGIEDAPGSPEVRYWEIYNEPDNGEEWRAEHGGYGYFGYRGDEYAALLDAIYPVVKAANSNAKVVFGGVAHDYFGHEGGGFDPDFVDDVLANCSGPCFDVMNFHYFPFYRFRWEVYGKDVIGKANYFRSKMTSYGFERPLICTETSWPSATNWGSESLQARYVIAVYVRGMAANLDVTSWFAWKDVNSGLPGLLNDQLQPKPAYYAFQTLTEQLGQAIFKRALSATETGDEDIEGYVFSVPVSSGWERRDVVWLDCDPLRLTPPQDCPGESRTMTVRADVVRVTSKFGVSRIREDSDDGLTDGLVTLTVTPDPVFIDYTP